MSSVHKSIRSHLAIRPFLSVIRPSASFCWQRWGPAAPLCDSTFSPNCPHLPGAPAFSSRPIKVAKIDHDKGEWKQHHPDGANLHFRETPSDALISALQARGLNIDVSEPKSYTVDLSWVNPTGPTDTERTARLKSHQGKSSPKQSARLSYATIVANYIRYVDPILSPESLKFKKDSLSLHPLDVVLLKVFDKKTMDYLSRRGYSAVDVMTWAWILLSPHPVTAAMRLAASKRFNPQAEASSSSRIPLFVLLFTLRRKAINLKALNLLLTHSWDMLLDVQPGKTAPQTQAGNQLMPSSLKPTWMVSGDDNTVMILFVRLIRAARRISPEALMSISDMFTSVFGYDAVAETMSDKRMRRLVTYYNKFLSLLAVPCRVEPYASTVIQQRSIFHLLREMTKFDPPLPVTREGYHAVTRVQGGRPKLSAERTWAEFKAKSWPPWKEDKLGIDVDRGLEGSKSKTIGSITRMKEAGYSPTRWDRIATILAGWDIDGTPTIQTRCLLPKPNPYRMRDQHTVWLKEKRQASNVDLLPGFRYEDTYHDVWAARIRATRTMKEAWACFLSCRDQGFRISNDIYFELVEKVIYHDYLQDSSRIRSTEALPGDGKEVYSEPSSPRDVIYVPSEPPTVEALLQQMFSQEIKLSKRLLVLILTHLTSFKSGLECLANSDLPPRQIHALTSTFSCEDPSRKKHLDSVRNDIFCAFIRFLCRFPGHEATSSGSSSILLSQIFPIARPTETRNKDLRDAEDTVAAAGGLSHAISLVRLRMPEYLPTWSSLLSSLANARLPVSDNRLSLSTQRALAWREVSEVLNWMEEENLSLDASCFNSVCEALSRWLLAIQNNERGRKPGLKILQSIGLSTTHISTDSEMASNGVSLVKRKFDQMVLSRDGPLFPSITGDPLCFGSPKHPALPTMFAIPSPSTLHVFIRVLALAGDFESLMCLLGWISRNSSDLRRVTKELLGGERSMRRAVTAARVYLEKNAHNIDPSSVPGCESSTSNLTTQSNECPRVELMSSMPNYFLQKAYDIVEGSDFLSPWPTDEEVRQYIAEHKGFF
ncbi:hypothetical protein D8B26_003191 [Coccidioides posadasii str. Silveira]|uniref:Uncharacterized protein n=1 Tax=Coccidioides posadasii (strain RMSCC 757 / Silveira) TaxID=443226 RepID=E9CYY2_COCPS|nr:conserved hypothetical protein [Coccidioides posadasii str. Silveira]QVM08502.1 hypothetical protein D8B26_003191 [Coccidioides posadasii str. Silveira]